MFRVKITPRAKKELKKIPNRYQAAVDQAFTELAQDPSLGKPLNRELSFRFSYRVGVYRIVYRVNQKDELITILTAGHRGKVYK